MNAMRPMLVSTWTSENPKGWLLSEKLDGDRALWDGGKLTSRLGNVFPAPLWFLDRLPQGLPLDGELWAGRGNYSRAMGIAKTHHGEAWHEIGRASCRE